MQMNPDLSQKLTQDRPLATGFDSVLHVAWILEESLPDLHEVRSIRDGSCVNVLACARAHRACAVAHTRYPVSGVSRAFSRGQRLADGRGIGPVIRTVHSGVLALCGALPDGRRQILVLATPGEVLCESRLDGLACWVEALAPSVVCEIDLSAHADAVRGDGELQHALVGSGRDRLQAALAHVIALGRLDGRERVTAFLLDMTHRLGRQEQGAWRVQLPLSREDIADYLGLNAETVSRILGRIKRSELAVFSSPTEFHVPDLDRLESRSPLRPLRRFALGPVLRAADAS